MKKDNFELPSDVQEQIRALEALPEGQVATTDAPEILDWSDARRGVFYRGQPDGSAESGAQGAEID